ncbi:hypothetical protein [Uliginosibacterium gangwonense]|uniref:hypothetical protein n=1 Tax=Uliginosibacterium gangwonense TaxID=392736 RepID=UPI000370EC6D|nr:hypothetical protein [Uliginosibacterium gangwonense]
MAWENRLTSWIEQLRPQIGISARLAGWDGREFDFGRHANPLNGSRRSMYSGSEQH